MKEIKIPRWLTKLDELCKQADKEIEQEKLEILRDRFRKPTS